MIDNLDSCITLSLASLAIFLSLPALVFRYIFLFLIAAIIFIFFISLYVIYSLWRVDSWLRTFVRDVVNLGGLLERKISLFADCNKLPLVSNPGLVIPLIGIFISVIKLQLNLTLLNSQLVSP